MKIEPSFPDHWKTELLVKRCGAEAVLCILRLWGAAQIDRKWTDLDLSPKRLAMKTKWFGDENHLWDVLTDESAPWLDRQENGLWAIHGFEEHHKQIIHLWQVGKTGGRPKKEKTEAPIVAKQTPKDNSLSLSLSLSPFENQMVSKCENDGTDFANGNDMQKRMDAVNALSPKWAKFKRWNYDEQQALSEVAANIDALDVDDLDLLRQFYSRETVDDKFFRPMGRAAFLRNLASVLDNARKWAGPGRKSKLMKA